MAAAKAVNRIGKPVFMQGAGNQCRCRQRQHGAGQRMQMQRGGPHQYRTGNATDQQADQWKGPDSPRQISAVQFAADAKRQTCQKQTGTHELAEMRPDPIRDLLFVVGGLIHSSAFATNFRVQHRAIWL
jgi:hypothetical protein